MSDEKAEELVNCLDEKGQLDIETETAKYKSLWKDDLTKFSKDLRSEMNELAINLRSEMKAFRVELRDTKIDLIKWMFGGFLAVFLAIIGLFFKK